MELYIIGFIVMFMYIVVELKDTGADVEFREWFIYFFGLILWPFVLGMLLYEAKKSMNKLLEKD